MDYDAIVTQALALLQREQRLAYRVLKLRLQLDDDLMEALKDDLIYAKKLAVDEDGRVLVWTGGTSSTPPTASPVPLPATPEVSPARGEAAPVAPPTPDAERRQLTVMFCDLVDSTRLSSQLDPEEYRDVVRAYQAACTAVIQRYEGHIAQLLGDGLLVYFGYPQAHEDDAQRAVRTGLGILTAMEDLQTRLQQEKGIQLGVRIGMHTGLVVVGEMGGGGRQEQLALGETPNIAARIQGLAAPNTIAISEASYRLVQGYFTYEALGEQTLRGLAEPLHVYRVLQESGVTSRLDMAQTRGLTPLVGRESEVTLLQERWAQVKDGQGQVVLLSGDAGIGKSRLVQMLKDHVADEPHVRWECRSSPYFENTALFPVTDLFQRLLRFQVEDTFDEKVGKLEQMLSQYRLPLEETVPLVAPLLLLPVPEQAYSPLHLSPQRQRQKTLEAIVAILLELAERQPLLFILEDLHWTDPTTLELLNLLLDQTPTASMLVLLTCRPHFQPAWHHRSYLTEITVNRLSPTQVAQLVNRMTDGKPLPQEVLAQIIEKTDGVPLFVEEMTKAVLESGQLQALDGHYELVGSFSTFVIPATLQDSLMARLDRLVTAKAVAQYAAVIGRQFAYDLLSTVSQLDQSTLQRELGRLVDAEIVHQRGVPPQATYLFKHALIQDTAYQSLLRSTRQQYHQRIAQVLEAQFPELCETQPELLAHHYTEAGFMAQAISYWQRAGQRAVERSANLEAIGHLTKGLAGLATLPETGERTRQELALLTTLGPAMIAIKGYGAPEVEDTYLRARALCQQVDDPAQLFPVVRGLWNRYLMRAEHQQARELGEQLLSLAHSLHDPASLVEAHRVLGTVLWNRGELQLAHEHLERGIGLYEPHQHRTLAFRYGADPGVVCRFYVAVVLWSLGYPQQARRRMEEARTLAQDLAHPHSLAFVLVFAAILHRLCGEVQAAYTRADAAMLLAAEHGFAQWFAGGTILRGWTVATQGQAAEGIAQIHQGLVAWRAAAAEVLRPSWLALLAEAYAAGDDPASGLHGLAEALVLEETTGERWYEAELYRLRGALLLQHAIVEPGEAEACFQQALTIARRQQAKSWELRAATSLSRLWQQQGKHGEARQLVADVYGWFTEGFDTADLQEAKLLLAELTG